MMNDEMRDAIQIFELRKTLHHELCPADETALAALRAQLADRWIPVSERLPERHQKVLACYESGEIVIDFYGNCGWTYISYGDVTRWMPLPSPPERT